MLFILEDYFTVEITTRNPDSLNKINCLFFFYILELLLNFIALHCTTRFFIYGRAIYITLLYITYFLCQPLILVSNNMFRVIVILYVKLYALTLHMRLYNNYILPSK